jgi:hypothetical protein
MLPRRLDGIQRATLEHRSFQATFEGQVFARKGKALRLWWGIPGRCFERLRTPVIWTAAVRVLPWNRVEKFEVRQAGNSVAGVVEDTKSDKP